MSGSSPGADSSLGVSAKFLEMLLANHGDYLDKPTGDFVEGVVKPTTEAGACSLAVHHKGDPTLVGPATVFFSHAYHFPLRESLEAMLRHARAKPDEVHYYWYDPVSLNQHNGGQVVPFATLRDGFSAQIRGIGEVLALMYPYQAPVNLTRCWCLFEIVTALQSLPRDKVTFVFSEGDEPAFLEEVGRDHTSAMRALQDIDSARSKAREEQDKENIHRLIREGLGFRHVDGLLAGELRDWQAHTALRLLGERERAKDDCTFTDLEVATLKYEVSRMLAATGSIEDALRLAGEVVDVRVRVLAPDSPDLAASYNNLAGLYQDQGKLDEAEELYLKDLAISEKVLAPDSPSLATSYNNLAGLYRAQGKLDEAEELYLKALAIREKVLAPDSPDLASSYNNLALLYRAQGKLDEAEELLLKARRR